jgi:hypothetical protein
MLGDGLLGRPEQAELVACVLVGATSMTAHAEDRVPSS